MWLKIDDGWAHHPKVKRAGLHGRALWVVAASECARLSTDGIVEADMLDEYVFRAQCDEGAAAKLVEVGLWHDAKTLRRCERCKKTTGRLAPGAFVFHDWFDYQFTRDEAKVPEQRMKARRTKELSRDLRLREAIIDRDGFMCRYCAVRVDFRNRSGDLGGTYDHVNPDGPNDFGNIVVACRRCNGVKKDRTPDEAGMVLLPVPDLAPASPGSSGGLAPGGPETGSAKPRERVTRETGRAGPGTGPGLAPAKSAVSSNGNGASHDS